MKSKRTLWITAALMTSTGFIGPAWSQTPKPGPEDQSSQPTSAAPSALEDIVVTARRTSERLQTTPVAVTALTPAMIERRQLVSVSDLQRATPGLSIGSGGTGPASEVMLAIRGNAQNNASSTSDPAVGMYIDGVYYARFMAGNLGLLDLANAEVLRGPQGTLFGRNTTGGALNLTTKQPTDIFEGYARAGLGNYDLKMFEGALNVPVGDELAARVAFRYDDRGAYGSNPFTSRDPANVSHDISSRATVKWSPKALPLTLTISGDYQDYRDNGPPSSLTAVNPTGLAALYYPGFANYISNSKHFYTTYDDPHTGNPLLDKLFNFNRSGGIMAKLEVNLDAVTVKSITAYRKSHYQNSNDLDATPSDVGAFDTDYRNHQFSEELQVSGSTSRLNWIGGLYYFREAGSEDTIDYTLDNATLAPGFVANLTAPNESYSPYTSSSKGIYAQVNYRLTDRLRITGGIRYTWDERTLKQGTELNPTNAPYPLVGGVFVQPGTCNTGPNTGQIASFADCHNNYKAKFSYPSWTAGLDYRLTDQLFVYAKTSGASLAGGFNNRTAPPGTAAFNPEHVHDVESGLKGDFLNHKLRTNVAIFYEWRNGVQNIVVDYIPGIGSTQYVRNAGNVRSYGGEFESTLLPWHGMEIIGNVAYLHSRYEKGSFISEGIDGPVDHSNEVVQQAPKWTWSIGATQTFNVPIGKLSFHADYDYVSTRAYYADTPDLTDPTLTTAAKQALITEYAASNRLSLIRGYGLLNGRVALEIAHPNLEIALWTRNLTGKHYFSNEFPTYTGLGYIIKYRGEPRTFGGTATFRF